MVIIDTTRNADMLLGEFHANIEIQNNAGSTALVWACKNGHIDIARICWKSEFHAKIDIQDKDGKMAEDYAKSSSYCAMFEALFVERRERDGYLLK